WAPGKDVSTRVSTRRGGLVCGQRDPSGAFDAEQLLGNRRMHVDAVGDDAHRDSSVQQQRERDARLPVMDWSHRVVDVGSEADACSDSLATLFEVGAGMA